MPPLIVITTIPTWNYNLRLTQPHDLVILPYVFLLLALIIFPSTIGIVYLTVTIISHLLYPFLHLNLLSPNGCMLQINLYSTRASLLYSKISHRKKYIYKILRS